MRPYVLISSTITRIVLIPKHSLRTPRVSINPLAVSTRNITKMSNASPQPNFSSNYDPEQAAQDLTPLLKGNGGKWELIGSGKGVERGFKFKTFKKTWVSTFCSVLSISHISLGNEALRGEAGEI
jgi:hypothetical protein